MLSKCQYKYKDLSKRDLLAALNYFKDLMPKIEKYVYPNGQEKDLISLFGTIPVNYNNNKYNIPIQLYLADNHPYLSPIVYVKPTAEMSINVSDTVDSNGRVSISYLNDWSYPSSDLYMLLNLLSIKFGEQTPLYSRKSAMSRPGISNSGPQANVSVLPYPTDTSAYGGPNRPPYPTSSTTSVSNPAPYPTSYSVGSGYPPANNLYFPMPTPAANLSHLKSSTPNTSIGQIRQASLYPYPTQPTAFTNSSSSYADETIKPEYYKMSLVSAVLDKVKQRFNDFRDEKSAEIDSLKRCKVDLEKNETLLNGYLNEMDLEIVNIRDLQSELKEKTSKLTNKLNRIEYRDKTNVEDAVVTTTPLYRQLLVLYAEELAIQDLIFYLGEGLNHQTITLDMFLKQIRSLSRKQFLLRATMQKAREKANLPV